MVTRAVNQQRTSEIDVLNAREKRPKLRLAEMRIHDLRPDKLLHDLPRVQQQIVDCILVLVSNCELRAHVVCAVLAASPGSACREGESECRRVGQDR